MIKQLTFESCDIFASCLRYSVRKGLRKLNCFLHRRVLEMLTFVSRVRFMLHDLEAGLLFTKKEIMLRYPNTSSIGVFYLIFDRESSSRTNPTILFRYQHTLNYLLASGIHPQILLGSCFLEALIQECDTNSFLL